MPKPQKTVTPDRQVNLHVPADLESSPQAADSKSAPPLAVSSPAGPQKTQRGKPTLAWSALFIAVVLSLLQYWLGPPAYFERAEIESGSHSIFDRLKYELRVARAKLTTDPFDDTAAKSDLANYMWYHGDKAVACRLYEQLLQLPDVYVQADIDELELQLYYEEKNDIPSVLRLEEIRHNYLKRNVFGFDELENMTRLAALYRQAGNESKAQLIDQAAEKARQVPINTFSPDGDTIEPTSSYQQYEQYGLQCPVGHEPDDARLPEARIALGLSRMGSSPNLARSCFVRAIREETSSESQRQRARILAFMTSVLCNDLTTAQTDLKPAQEAADWLVKRRHKNGLQVSREEAIFALCRAQYMKKAGDLNGAMEAAEQERQLRNQASGPLLSRVSIEGEE